jgi:hypothetical protein
MVASLTIDVHPVQAATCGVPGTPPCPPKPPSNNPPTDVPIIVPTKTLTPTATSTPTLTPTPTQTATSTSTPKPTGLAISSGFTGSNNPNGELPAIQNPGPFGWIIPGLIIIIGGVVGVVLLRKRSKLGSTGNTGLLPAIQKGGKESATLTVRDGADLGGGNESATLTVHDGVDLGGGKESATMTIHEVANDPGGVQIPPGPPDKPPSPNLGDLSSGVQVPPGPPIKPPNPNLSNKSGGGFL